MEKEKDSVKSLVRGIIHRTMRTELAQRLMKIAWDDEEVMAFTIWHLCDRSIREASLEGSGGLDFTDLMWLWSKNPLSAGASQLSLVEGAYFYELISGLQNPRVCEIGRFRGGTTFLFAAAGGSVFSIDIDGLGRQEEFDKELRAALERHGLSDQVELVIGNSQTYYMESLFDLIYLDGDYSYSGRKRDFNNWWKLVKPGGSLIVHKVIPSDIRWPVIGKYWMGNSRFCLELESREDGEIQDSPPTLTNLMKKE